MAKVTVPSDEQAEQFQISPDYVRISMAAAIELGLKPGRINRCNCNCINLLQNYPEGCYANCTYCGLARERPGTPEENTFIRVAWPLYPTDLVAEKIAGCPFILAAGLLYSDSSSPAADHGRAGVAVASAKRLRWPRRSSGTLFRTPPLPGSAQFTQLPP
jgi:hypothetical protein